jgi:UDP-glucose 4-epimerase
VRVLVTGGAGYIGSVVTARLLQGGHDVVVADDLSTGHADAVPPGAHFHEASIDSLDEVLARSRVDAVMHFAARSLVGESTQEPAAYWHANVGGSLALFDAMRRHGVTRIVFSSSAAVYGDRAEQPIPESAAALPSSPYGATKLAVDLALRDYAASYGFAACSLRYFNVAGALVHDGYLLGEQHPTETHLIPIALHAAAGSGPPVSVFGTDYPTPDGTGIRDYIHVVDLADGHVRALEVCTPGAHRVVNLGTGSGHSVREVLAAVERVTRRPVPVREAARRAGDPAVLVASNTVAGRVLGWRPRLDLRRIISDAWTFEKAGALAAR